MFCELIGANGERHRQPRATCPPNALATLLTVGDKRPIVVDGVDVDVDVNVGLVVRCASIVRSLRQTLLVWCEAARVDAPTFMWE